MAESITTRSPPVPGHRVIFTSNNVSFAQPINPRVPPGPLRTVVTLEKEFRNMGISSGDIIVVHASLRSIGWVNGGAEAVVRALLAALGTEGTLVVPTHTDYLTLSDDWSNPPVPPEWNLSIQDTMLPFDPKTSRSRCMGEIAETVRTWPGARRSHHPRTSFAAIGPHAEEITATHTLVSILGEESPLGTLERLNAQVLLLGVGFERCTAFHLAEYRIPRPPLAVESFPSEDEGPDRSRIWTSVTTVDLNGDDFGALGAAFEKDGGGLVRRSLVGGASCALFPMAGAVAYAQGWFMEHRKHVQSESVE